MRILIIRFSSLGDVVLATSAVENIINSYPSAEIFLLTKRRYAPLFEGDLRATILTFKVDQAKAQQIKELYGTAKLLRQLKFDLVIDLQCNPRSLLLRSFSGAKRVIAYPKGHLERLSFVKKKNFKEPYIHAVDRYNIAVKEAGMTVSNRLPKLSVTEEEKRFGQGFLEREGVSSGRPLVGIHFGAKHPTKRWGDEKFAKLAKMLTGEFDLDVLAIPSEKDLDQEKLFSEARGTILWSAALSLRELKGLISCCNMMVCSDSGVMHMAVGLGVPVVALFGPTHPCLGFYPLGESDILLSSYEPCSPCSLHGEKRCIRDKKYCMENISISQVRDAVVSILNRKGENIPQHS